MRRPIIASMIFALQATNGFGDDSQSSNLDNIKTSPLLISTDSPRSYTYFIDEISPERFQHYLEFSQTLDISVAEAATEPMRVGSTQSMLYCINDQFQVGVIKTKNADLMSGPGQNIRIARLYDDVLSADEITACSDINGQFHISVTLTLDDPQASLEGLKYQIRNVGPVFKKSAGICIAGCQGRTSRTFIPHPVSPIEPNSPLANIRTESQIRATYSCMDDNYFGVVDFTHEWGQYALASDNNTLFSTIPSSISQDPIIEISYPSAPELTPSECHLAVDSYYSYVPVHNLMAVIQPIVEIMRETMALNTLLEDAATLPGLWADIKTMPSKIDDLMATLEATVIQLETEMENTQDAETISNLEAKLEENRWQLRTWVKIKDNITLLDNEFTGDCQDVPALQCIEALAPVSADIAEIQNQQRNKLIEINRFIEQELERFHGLGQNYADDLEELSQCILDSHLACRGVL